MVCMFIVHVMYYLQVPHTTVRQHEEQLLLLLGQDPVGEHVPQEGRDWGTGGQLSSVMGVVKNKSWVFTRLENTCLQSGETGAQWVSCQCDECGKK